jgi:hypothetical protein
MQTTPALGHERVLLSLIGNRESISERKSVEMGAMRVHWILRDTILGCASMAMERRQKLVVELCIV